MDKKPESLLNRGARNGAIMGIYFVVLFAALVMGYRWQLASLLALAMMVGTPFLLYRHVRQSFISLHGMTTMSALWLEGIVSMACGALILALASFVFFRFIDPDFLPTQLTLMADFYETYPSEQYRDLGTMLRRMVDNNLMPRPIQVAISLAWMTAFTGSLLSLVVAAIAHRPIKQKPY